MPEWGADCFRKLAARQKRGGAGPSPRRGVFRNDAGLSCWPLVLKLRAAFLRSVLPGLLVGALSAGCASAPPPAAAPMAPAPLPSSEPALPQTLNLTELESLEHDLRQSEARLDAELARKREVIVADSMTVPEPPSGSAGVGASKPADSAGPGAAPAAGPRPEAPPRPNTPKPDTPAPPGTGDRGSACDLGCRALASMQRAQARICEIAGPGPRCQSALDRVRAAAERVRRAGCECLPAENR